MEADYTIKVISTEEDLIFLKKDWEEIYQHQQAKYDVHLDFSWILLLWQHLVSQHSDMLILSCYDTKSLTAIVPLKIEKHLWMRVIPLRRICFLVSGYSDWGDILFNGISKEHLFENIFRFLSKNFNWTEIVLQDISSDSSTYTALKNLKDQTINFKETTRCYSIDTRGEWNDYIDFIPSKSFVKQDIQRLRNKLKKLKMEWRYNVENYIGNKSQWEIVQNLHRKSQLRNGRQSFFDDAATCTFYREVFHKYGISNKLQLHTLSLSDKIIAFVLGIFQHQIFYYWIVGFDTDYEKFSPSKFLLFNIVEKGFQSECREINFMRGDTDYKKKWAKDFSINYSARVMNIKGLWGFFNRLRLSIKWITH